MRGEHQESRRAGDGKFTGGKKKKEWEVGFQRCKLRQHKKQLKNFVEYMILFIIQ